MRSSYRPERSRVVVAVCGVRVDIQDVVSLHAPKLSPSHFLEMRLDHFVGLATHALADGPVVGLAAEMLAAKNINPVFRHRALSGIESEQPACIRSLWQQCCADSDLTTLQ